MYKIKSGFNEQKETKKKNDFPRFVYQTFQTALLVMNLPTQDAI